MFYRVAPAFAIVLGLASAAHAQTPAAQPADMQGPPAPAPIEGTPGKDFSGTSPANLAGIMNYCIENQYVSYDAGNPVLYGLSDKYKTTQPNEHGNDDYALGTAGQFVHAGKTYIIPAYTSVDDRKAACASALKASQSFM